MKTIYDKVRVYSPLIKGGKAYTRDKKWRLTQQYELFADVILFWPEE